jgi:hypothetical protein
VRETLARKIASTALRAEGDVLALAAEERVSGGVVADERRAARVRGNTPLTVI